MSFNYHQYGGYIGSTNAVISKTGLYDIKASQTIGDALFAFSSFTFNNGATTGRLGPTLTALRNNYNTATYPWINDSNFFDQGEFQGYQKFTIPSSGNYRITARGAAGGQKSHLSYRNGTFAPLGAQIVANFTFVKGAKIQIIVGQRGEDDNTYYPTQNSSSEGDNAAPGGGGATWVFTDTSDFSSLLIAAGGGAGGTKNTYTNANASLASNGSGNNSQQSGSNGGENGSGGQSNNGGSSYWAGAGAGWLSDGTGGNQSTNFNYVPGNNGAEGGRSPSNNAYGGIKKSDNTNSGGNGGFGGGGGGGSDNMGTGGGAGYSGGGGGNSSTANAGGGGGGCFSSDNSATITQASTWDHGSVLIEQL